VALGFKDIIPETRKPRTFRPKPERGRKWSSVAGTVERLA
jgi:hypothetical protein